MPTTLPLPPRPRWVLVGMILMSVIYTGVFAFSLLAALMSPMVFDSGDTPRNMSAFFAFLFFPLLILACVAFAWTGFGIRRYALIVPSFLLPAIYCIIFWFSFS